MNGYDSERSKRCNGKLALQRSHRQIHRRVSAIAGRLGLVLLIASAVFVSGPQKLLADNAYPAVPTAQIGHDDFVTAIRFSPDGSRILSLGTEGSAKLWDVASGRLLRTFSINGGAIETFAFSPDSKQIVTGSGDLNSPKVWNAATGELVEGFKADASGFFEIAAISPDGRTAVAGTADTVKLLEMKTGRLVRELKSQDGTFLLAAFSPRGDRIVTAAKTDEIITIWDVATGRLLSRKKRPAGSLFAVAYGKAGPRAIIQDMDGTNTALIDAQSLSELHTFRTKPKQLFDKLAISRNSRSIAAAYVQEADDETIQGVHVFDSVSGRLIRSFEGLANYIANIALSPDGARVAVVFENNTFAIWDVASGTLLQKFEATQNRVWEVSVSPDGEFIAATGEMHHGLDLWNLATGQHARMIEGRDGFVGSGLFARDPSRFFSAGGDETAKLWNVTDGTLLRAFNGHKKHIYSLAACDVGGRLATGSWDKTIKLWDVATGRALHTIKGHSDRINDLDCSPDGRTVVSAGNDKTVKLWDAMTGRLVREFEKDEYRKSFSVLSVAFSPDGRIIAGGSAADRLHFWDTQTGELIRTIHGLGDLVSASAKGVVYSTDGHAGDVHSVAFSADGTHLLSGSEDQTVKLWDVSSGKLIRTFKGHTGGVASVAFLTDGKRITSGAHDGIKIWDRQNGELLVTMVKFTKEEWLAVTPEGYFAASRNGAKRLAVVRGFESYSIDQFFQTLYRPDLVKEKLAGDPRGMVRKAAAELDLDKIIASGAAPKVTIKSPVEGASVSDDKLSVEAEVTDAGGGIGRIEWRVNGVTLGIKTKRGFERVARRTKTAKPIVVRQDLWLEPGRNKIEVVAYNARNLIASDPVSITVNWDGVTTKTPPRLHVLAIGINDYFDSRLKLNFAVPDAKALGEALKKAGTGLYKDVSVTTVLDRNATATGLDAVFSDLAAEVRPRDVFVFFLAGHGKTVDGRYYFIPQDFRYKSPKSIIDKGIGQDQWQRWFSRIPARKSILLYDTCESGSLTGPRIATRGLERVAALDKLTRAMGRTVLSAATDDAPALEGYRGHGVFTYALLDALNGSDANKNDLIEVTELAGHIDARVPEISQSAFGQRQLPQMNIVGSNFPLARRTLALAKGAKDRPSAGIAKTPTHVVIKPSGLFAKAGGVGTAIETLAPGTQVTLMKTEQGWTLVARDGKRIGYVAKSSLVRLQ